MLENFPFTDRYLSESKGYLIIFGALYQIVQIGMRAWGDMKRHENETKYFKNSFEDVTYSRDGYRHR